MGLYNDYLEMIAEAEYFMKVHEIKISGTNVESGTAALVITKESLDKFAEKLKKADIIDTIERRKKDLLEENQKMEKEKVINNALDMLRKSDNPYNVPEQSSGSDDAAFYFPLGEV